MTPVNTLHKSLVEVGLGAFSFLCTVDRSAVSITRSLPVLCICIAGWVTLAVMALSTRALVGGETATERFSELAPVLVLSSPMLWAALRKVQVLLEMMDAVQGVLALVTAWLRSHTGVFDEPLSLVRSRSVHAQYHAIKRTDGEYFRLARLFRRVHPQQLCDCVDSESNESRKHDKDRSVTFETKYSLSLRWTRELLPFAASDDVLLSQHITSDSFLKHNFTYRSQWLRSEDPQNYRIKFMSLSTFSYRFRYVLHHVKRFARRAAPRATCMDGQLALDNIPVKWVVRPHGRRSTILLLVRRTVYSWPALFVKHLQGILSSVITSFDSLVGEIGAFLLLSVMEFAHPLRIRRENALNLLLTNCAIVKDLAALREASQKVGLDSFMVRSADAVVIKLLLTVFQGRPDLSRAAIMMIRVGQLWRVKPPGYTQKYNTSFPQLFLGGFELPMLDADDVDAMELVPFGTESSVDVMSTSHDDPMILLSRGISNLALFRLEQMSGNERDGIKIYDALSDTGFQDNAKKNEVIQCFCVGWSIRLSNTGLYNAFDFENCSNEQMRACLYEMVNVNIDCHAVMLCSALNSSTWFDSSLSHCSEYKRNISDLALDMKKVEQHEVLVALHKNEVRAAAWLFCDEVGQGEWLNWQKWCIADALELAELVFG